jgi:hypothetical protein
MWASVYEKVLGKINSLKKVEFSFEAQMCGIGVSVSTTLEIMNLFRFFSLFLVVFFGIFGHASSLWREIDIRTQSSKPGKRHILRNSEEIRDPVTYSAPESFSWFRSWRLHNCRGGWENENARNTNVKQINTKRESQIRKAVEEWFRFLLLEM